MRKCPHSKRNDRDGDGIDDAGDEVGIAHPRHAALSANVRRDALESHDGDGTRVLGDTSLLRCDDVHDDAALEHIRHAALDGEGAGAGSGLLCAQSWSSVCEPSVVSTPEKDRRLREKMLTLRMLLLGP